MKKTKQFLKKSYLSVFLLLLSFFNISNLFSVEKTYTDNTTPLKDKGMNIMYDEGNYILAGSTRTTSCYKICLTKVDKSGGIIWTNLISLEGSSYDTRCLAIDFNQDKDGYVITGYVDINTNPLVFDNRAFIAEINKSTGAVVWSKIYNMAGGVGMDIKRTQDNGYVVAGYMSNVMDAFSSFTTGFVFRVDNTGATSWIKIFDNTTVNNTPDYDMAESVFPYLENGVQKYYVTGSISDPIQWNTSLSTFVNSTAQKVLSAKLDYNGTLLWDQSFSNKLCTDALNTAPDGYSLSSGADAAVIGEEGIIINISNSYIGEGAYMSIISESTGNIISTFQFYESSSTMNLHQFNFNNLFVRNDTIFIFGIANNIYCDAPYQTQTELFSPIELVIATNNFTTFSPTSTKIYRLRNYERQDLENDWLGNTHNYYLSNGSINNCGFSNTPIIYTPKIGTIEGTPSIGMNIELEFPLLGTNAFFDDWEVALVGTTSHFVVPFSQHTFINGIWSTPCHMLQLNNPTNDEITSYNYPNSWNTFLFMDSNGTDYPTSPSYDIDSCIFTAGFVNCNIQSVPNNNEGELDLEWSENINEIYIYPNPSNDVFKLFCPSNLINSDEIVVNVYDNTGKIISSRNIFESITNFEVPNSGLYLLTVAQNGITIKQYRIVSIKG